MLKALAGYRSALAHRDLRLLLTGELVSSSGSWAYNVALAVWVFERTHSAVWVSAVFLVRFIPSMLLSTYGGVLAERFERIRLLISLDLLLAGWQVLLALVVAFEAPVPLALVVAACGSISATPYVSAVAATIPQLAGEADLTAANALNSTIDNLVLVLGPAFGALLLLTGLHWIPFLVNAATFLFAAAMVLRISVRSHPSDVTEGGEAGPFKQMLVGVKTIASSPVVLVLVSFSVAASFVYGTDTVLFVYISKYQLGTGANGYGYLLAALGVGGVLAALVVNQLAGRPRLGAVISAGLAVYCLPTALLVVVHSPELAFLLEVVRGGGTLVVDVLAITALQRSVAPTMVARVFGVFFTLVLAAISLGSVLGAVLVSTIRLHPSLLVMGFAIPALAACSYPALRRMDDRAERNLAQLAPRIELLGGLGIFAAGSRVVLERLAEACTEETVPRGTVIIREGDVADAFYVLRSGSVDIKARGGGTEERHLNTEEAGGYFGEIGLLEQIPRTATVTALEECSLYRIQGDQFLDALAASPPTQLFLEGTKTRLGRSHPTYRPRSSGGPLPAAGG